MFCFLFFFSPRKNVLKRCVKTSCLSMKMMIATSVWLTTVNVAGIQATWPQVLSSFVFVSKFAYWWKKKHHPLLLSSCPRFQKWRIKHLCHTEWLAQKKKKYCFWSGFFFSSLEFSHSLSLPSLSLFLSKPLPRLFFF